MDLSHILLWLAGASSLMHLHRLWRAPGPRAWEWIVPHALILATGALLFPYSREWAGNIAGGLYLALVLVPTLLSHTMTRLSARAWYGPASVLAHVAAVFHPAPSAWATARLLTTLRQAHRGDVDGAARRLESLFDGPAGAGARLQWFRLHNDWPGLLAWVEGPEVPPPSPELVLARLRAYGELGRHDDLALMFDHIAHGWPVTAWQPQGALARLLVLAFTGRVAGVTALLAGTLRHHSSPFRAFWEATARLNAGETQEAAALFIGLTAPGSGFPPALLEQRREACAAPVLVDVHSYAAASAARLEGEVMRQEERERRVRLSPGTRALIVLNGLMFIAEFLAGGTENELALLKLGAFVPALVTEGGAWRALTGLFLHFGWLHLSMNMLALFVLGRRVEAALGVPRFLTLYFGSGVIGMAAVYLAGKGGMTSTEIVVGASGCIMGIVGGLAALLLRQWRANGTHASRQRFYSILFALALQSAFDLSTPQVSMTAHLGGAISGALIAWLLTWKRPAEWV